MLLTKKMQNAEAVAANAGRLMHNEARNNGMPRHRPSMAKLSKAGSRPKCTTPATGIDRAMPFKKLRLDSEGFSLAANRLNTTPQIDIAPRPDGQAVYIQNAATAKNATAQRNPASTPCSMSLCHDMAPGAPGGTLPCSSAWSVSALCSIKRNNCASAIKQYCASWPKV